MPRRRLLVALLALTATACGAPEPDASEVALALERTIDHRRAAVPRPPPGPTPGYAPLVLSLTFDDTHDEHHLVADKIVDLPSTFYVNSPRLGQPGYLAADDLHALAAAGHEIGAHTLSHPHLPDLDDAAARSEMCDDRDALRALGHTVTTLAYPFGDDSPAVHQLARACGFAGARDIGGLRNADPWAGDRGYCGTPASSLSRPAAEQVKPRNPYAIRSRASIRASCSHDDLVHMVLAAAADATELAITDPRWLVLNFHDVCAGCPGTYAVDPRRLGDLVAWVRGQGGVVPVLDARGRVVARRPLVVATVGDVIAGAIR